jgi:hypothetical protein
MWLYRAALRADFENPDSLIGYEVVGIDGTVGRIVKASTETLREFLVVERGRFGSLERRVIASGAVTRVDNESHRVFVEVSHREMSHAPRDEQVITGVDGMCYDNESVVHADR